MSDRENLAASLRRLEGKPYGHYRDFRGSHWEFDRFLLIFHHIQGDPFAAPSRIEIDVSPRLARLPPEVFVDPVARRASADFIQRHVRRALQKRRGSERRGSGKSGRIELAPLGQQVLDRTAVEILENEMIVIRLTVGLPARGRRIMGHEAADLLTKELPALITDAFASLDQRALRVAREVVADQVALREALPSAGLVAFLAEGSILPRRSGADDRPMRDGIPLQVPPDLAVELETPHSGRLRGLGIPTGVTLIVGGGYHGKSTLLDALLQGVYDHIPGDGRERCVTIGDAVGIRAEDGRSVKGVDLRPFIRTLPLGRSTDCFHTEDASGSTSQAAAIIEAIELGARVLLMDEDTSATNFMIRDARMQRLIPRSAEPITPYIERIRQLHDDLGISSVLVVGGAGDYLDVADTVIHMDTYQPRNRHADAVEIARALPLPHGPPKAPDPWPRGSARIPRPAGFDPRHGRKPERIRSMRTTTILYGDEEIDLSFLSQLVDPAQCRWIGDCLLELSRGLCDGQSSISEILDEIDHRSARDGLAAFAEQGFGDRARARRYEIGAAINRLRSLVVDIGREGR